MIWLLGGGEKTHELTVLLKQMNRPYKLSTIRDYNHDMPLSYASKVLYEPPSREVIQETIKRESISCIIDHTYGELTKLSKEVIDICKANCITYIKYDLQNVLDELNAAHIHVVSQLREAKEVLEMTKGNIFIRLNRKAQKDLQVLQINKTLYGTKMNHHVLTYQDISYQGTEEDGEAKYIQEVLKKYKISCIILHEKDEKYINFCKKLDEDLIIIRKNNLEISNKFCNIQQLREYLHNNV